VGSGMPSSWLDRRIREWIPGGGVRKGAREGRREGGRSTGVPLCRDAGWMVKVCILGNKSAFYDEDFDSPEISLGESNIPPEKALKSLYSGL